MSQTEIAYVYLNEIFVGELKRDKGEYSFLYDAAYHEDATLPPLSLSLPKASKSFRDSRLFPFFEGLLSEGWLKKVQEQTQKIDQRDSFRRLVENGEELIGAVSILKVKK